MNKLIVGGIVAVAAMLIMAGCIIAAGLAKAEPTDPCDAACHRSWDHWNSLDQQGKKDYLCSMPISIRPSDC